jgi:hypothetical protein
MELVPVSRILLATAAGLALLSGTVAAVPAKPSPAQVNLAEPCPCTNPICKPGCHQQ